MSLQNPSGHNGRFRREQCPVCGEDDTEQATTQFEEDHVVEVRTCLHCTVQFTNNFGNPYKEVDHCMAVSALIDGPEESIDQIEENFDDTVREGDTQVRVDLESVPSLFAFLEENDVATDNIEVEA